jgi:hypothetical protein
MLYNAKTLKGWNLQATDGQIGKIDEFYFDDGSWEIRYLVVDVGNWLKRQPVLLVPESVIGIALEGGTIDVALTREAVKNSPDALEQNTVSRQMEIALHHHYDWTPYWDVDPVGTNSMGRGPSTIVQPYGNVKADIEVAKDATTFASAETKARAEEMAAEDELVASGHLRSSKEVAGYHLQALDGEIGHISDFMIEDTLNAISYLVVDTRNWLPGKKVLIPPNFVHAIHWDGSKVDVAMTKEELKNSPEYNENDNSFMPGKLEHELQEYYNRKSFYTL